MTKKRIYSIFVIILIGVGIILYEMSLPCTCDNSDRAKSAVEKANIRNINMQIELYKTNTGFYPKYPNMDEMFLSASYFPDGPSIDPFTSQKKLGTYKINPKTKKVSLKEHNHLLAEGHKKISVDN